MKINAGTYHLVAGNQLSCKSGEYRITSNNDVGYMTTDCGGFTFVPDEQGFFIFNEEATVHKEQDSPDFTIEAGDMLYTFRYRA